MRVRIPSTEVFLEVLLTVACIYRLAALLLPARAESDAG